MDSWGGWWKGSRVEGMIRWRLLPGAGLYFLSLSELVVD